MNFFLKNVLGDYVEETFLCVQIFCINCLNSASRHNSLRAAVPLCIRAPLIFSRCDAIIETRLTCPSPTTGPTAEPYSEGQTAQTV